MLLVALLAFSCYKIYDNITTIKSLNNDIAANTTTLELAQQLSRNKDSLMNSYNALKNKIPSTEEQSEIIKQLEKVTTKHHASVSLQFKEEKTEGEFTAYPIEITIEKLTYGELMSMITDITKADRFFRIDELQIINVTDDKDADKLEVKGRLVLAAFKK